MIGVLAQRLRATQNADGGWGAVRGRQSNTESTALATLALGHGGGAERSSAERGIGWLRRCQRRDGSWPLTAAATTSSWTTSLAVIALRDQGAEDGARRGAEWLVGHRGKPLGLVAALVFRWAPDQVPTRLDPQLRGWSWTADEFSWVEPTAYALLALKLLGARGDRSALVIAEAERMLYDRACTDGGWNYGNSTAYGVTLTPYLETTALALLALQDRRQDDRTLRGFYALNRMLPDATSGLGLAWSILCLRAFGVDVTHWIRRLHEVHARTDFLGETKPAALALIAATDGRTFRIA